MSERLRADALRNRARVADAARSAFAQLGVDAPIVEIARRAGVGSATLYRRFPTREDLLELVFEDRIEHCATTVSQFAQLAKTDPWDAVSGYLRTLFTLQCEDRAFTAVLLHPFPADGTMEHERQRAMAGLGEIIRLAKDAGAIRPDFDIADMAILLRAHEGVLSGSEPRARRADSARMIEWLLDAIRNPTHPTPSHRPAP